MFDKQNSDIIKEKACAVELSLISGNMKHSEVAIVTVIVKNIYKNMQLISKFRDHLSVLS